MHPPMGGGVSIDFKFSNRIKISWLVQILLHFYWFGAPTPEGVGWVEWVSRGLGMMWRPSRQCGDDMGITGMTWGPWGPCGDNEITKNAITFEWIEIIEFHLKIWDTWALPHTYTLHLMYSWGCPIPNDSFIPKLLLWPAEKNVSCFCTGSN